MMALDPVCGREVHPKQSQWLLSYRSKIYHFCSGACAHRFSDFPDEFAPRDETPRPTLFEAPTVLVERSEEFAFSR
jgi:YHS domain-containing protein